MEYTCPMHPEIKQKKPGKCPKCGGMKLVPVNSLETSIRQNKDMGLGKVTWKSYMPLATIIGLILLATSVLAFRDYYQLGNYSAQKTISYFMIGFFLTFSGLKLIDLKGFAEGYSTYDLLAKRAYAYGYIYPFIELFFGLAMILAPASRPLLITEIFVMSFSGLGVGIKLAKKEKFQCVCLGTFLKVPLTKITLAEDFGMALLGMIMLLL